jgi:hypothetical protein
MAAVTGGTGTGALFGAPHVAAVPPFVPAQLHAHGPELPTAEAVPALHRLAPDGALATGTPSAAPHAPFTRVGGGGGGGLKDGGVHATVPLASLLVR